MSPDTADKHVVLSPDRALAAVQTGDNESAGFVCQHPLVLRPDLKFEGLLLDGNTD